MPSRDKSTRWSVESHNSDAEKVSQGTKNTCELYMYMLAVSV